MDKSQSNNNKRKRSLKPIKLLSGIEEVKNTLEISNRGGLLKYGISILDDCVETIRPGSTTVIIAAPNTGKSMFGLILAENIAKQNKRVLICSCEMGAGLIIERELRRQAGVRMTDLKQIYEEHYDQAIDLLDNFYNNKKYNFFELIDICETNNATIDDILDMLEATPYEYVIIDYIQRVRGVGTDYEVISDASAKIQAYAREHGTAFIICSQASRQSVDDGKYGKIQDGMRLRGKGSGSIEEDADVGLTLMELKEQGLKKILVTLFKNRYGNIKDVAYKYRLTDRLHLVLEAKGDG